MYTYLYYTGYDFQYFLGTLTPVLDSLHGLPYYHVYTMALDFLKPCAFTQAQDRYASFGGWAVYYGSGSTRLDGRTAHKPSRCSTTKPPPTNQAST